MSRMHAIYRRMGHKRLQTTLTTASGRDSEETQKRLRRDSEEDSEETQKRDLNEPRAGLYSKPDGCP